MTRNYSFALPALLVALLLMAGCSTVPKVAPDSPPPIRSYEDVVTEKPALQISDPLEGFNRGMYRFNYYFDKYLFLPVVSGYKFIMPDYAEQRVSDFFDNLGEITNFTNAVLQLQPKKAAITAHRFFINTIIGVGGLWDIASLGEVYRQPEDFGQTLGYYGVGNGPFLILPIYGPSNLRDAGGLIVDSATMSAIDPLNLDTNDEYEIPYYLLYAIDARKRVPFKYYGTGNPFEYELIRLLYTKKRQFEIEN